jgi:putative tryptophan/tyrosine transport system substrate-binding protein
MFRRLVLAVPFPAFAPWCAGAQERVHRIGVLGSRVDPEIFGFWQEGLRRHGYVESRNLHVDYRYYKNRTDQIPLLAAELAGLRRELIVAPGPAVALAIGAAAPTIPLVFVNVADPVELGLVQSLARPGGNATGVATIVPEGFTGKKIQLIKEFVPNASKIAALHNPANPIHQRTVAALPEIERQLGIRLVLVEASRPDQLAPAFAAASEQGAEAIDIWGEVLTFNRSSEIVGLADRYRLSAVYFARKSVVEGGLISFGPDQRDRWRRAGAYIDMLWKLSRPSANLAA